MPVKQFERVMISLKEKFEDLVILANITTLFRQAFR
jgi:hypothetical protein